MTKNKTELPEFLNDESISPKLRELILDTREKLANKESNIDSIILSLENLVTFLASDQGRTEANCAATDLYFCMHNDYSFSWDHLPNDLQVILNDIGGQLHDTVSAREIATKFESTPEQLLMRIRKLK